MLSSYSILGLKTLALRVRHQNANAMSIATYLHTHSHVKKVYYPGLESHTDHLIAKQQMHGGFGGMLAFELKVHKEMYSFLHRRMLQEHRDL